MGAFAFPEAWESSIYATRWKQYTEHYHVERNHQGLDNQLIEERHGVVDINSSIERHERLGGILNDYERRAA